MQIIPVPIEQLLASEKNPRTSMDEAALGELTASIKEHGLLDPIRGVREGDHIRIESGHRRHAAACAAGLDVVPVILVEQDDLEEEVRAIVTNLQREDLNVIDEARSYQALIATRGLTVQGVAQKLSVSPTRVTQRLELLEFDGSIIAMFAAGKLSPNTRVPLKAIARVSTSLALGVAKHVAKKGWDTPLCKAPGEVVQRYAQETAKAVMLPGRFKLEGRKLTPAAQESLEELDKLYKSESDNPTVFFTQQDADAAKSAGVGYSGKGSDYVVVDDQAWLDDRIEVALERRVKEMEENAARLKAAKSSAKGEDVPATEAELIKETRRAERQANLDARVIAHQANTELGQILVTQLAKIDVGPMPMPLAKAIANGLIGERRSELFLSGLRYCLPQFITEVEDEKKGIRREFVKTSEAAAAAMTEWMDGAESPAEVIGRAVCALIASQYADQGVVPQSERRPTGLPRGAEGMPYGVAMHEFGRLLVPKALQAQVKPSEKHVRGVMSKLAKAQEAAAK